MGLPRNVLDNVPGYVGLVTDPDREVKPDPPDGSLINGRQATPDEVDVIKAARQAERAAGAAMVAGIGPRKKG